MKAKEEYSVLVSGDFLPYRSPSWTPVPRAQQQIVKGTHQEAGARRPPAGTLFQQLPLSPVFLQPVLQGPLQEALVNGWCLGINMSACKILVQFYNSMPHLLMLTSSLGLCHH